MKKNRMFMSRAPLRITFAGGGTDLPDFFRRFGPGACVSATINKYVYVVVNKKFDNKIRVSYSTTEIVDSVDEIKHPTIRESLRLLDIDGGIEIVSISDIPSSGTGLGSSSTFLVALLNALHAYRGEYISSNQLAKEAVKIEREILREPGGLQDQYIAAYGGLRIMKFFPDGNVAVNPIISGREQIKDLEENLMLMYTGKTRPSSSIHLDQTAKVENHLREYQEMRDIALGLPEIISSGDLKSLGKAVDQNWELKTKLADGITLPWIDSIIRKGIKAGAVGAKLIGAGGGGFVLFVAPKENQREIEKALPQLRRERFNLRFSGPEIIFVGDD